MEYAEQRPIYPPGYQQQYEIPEQQRMFEEPPFQRQPVVYMQDAGQAGEEKMPLLGNNEEEERAQEARIKRLSDDARAAQGRMLGPASVEDQIQSKEFNECFGAFVFLVCCICCVLLLVLIPLFTFNVIQSNPGVPTPAPAPTPPTPTLAPNDTWAPPATEAPFTATPILFPTPPPPITPNTTLNPIPGNNRTTVPPGTVVCNTSADCDGLPNVVSATCVGGLCKIIQCANTYENCNNLTTDGCESPVLIDIWNCGTCGHVCSYFGGVPSCFIGTCYLTGCMSGFSNCNASTTGCYYSTATDPRNCGGCGNQCVTPNAVAACTNGTCAVASCNTYWADCDGSVPDGCETFTPNNTQRCGGCFNNCTAQFPNAFCGSGTCYVRPNHVPPVSAGCPNSPPTSVCSVCGSGFIQAGNCTLSQNGRYCFAQSDCITGNSQCSNQGVCGGANV
jgi:hypothetical protein